jgi:hypothetical protein
LSQNHNGFQESHEKFWFLFLAGIYALTSFVIFSSFQAANYKTKSDIFYFYISGWSLFVPLGIGMAILVRKFLQVDLKISPPFGIATVFPNFIFLLYLLNPTTWLSRNNWDELIFFLLMQCGILLMAKSIQPMGWQLSTFLEKSLTISMMSFFIIWVLSLLQEPFIFLKKSLILNTIFSVFLFFLLYFFLPESNGKDKKIKPEISNSFFVREFFSYSLALIFTGLLVIDPNFNFNRFHYSFFLGPLADLQGGKSLLYDINNQYGVLIFYFLSIFFKILPLGFKSLCFVVTVLYVVQYFCFYFVLRQLFDSKFFSFICFSVLLIVNYFATPDYLTAYPSVGPLRFGFIYLLLVLVVLRNNYEHYRLYFYLAESAVVASAVFWSFEVCFYTLPAYLAFIFYENVSFDKRFKVNGKLLVRRIFFLMGFCFLILIFIYGDVFRRIHDWPHWAYYFDYVLLYKNGFGMLWLPAFGSWWILVGILLASLFVILGGFLKTKDITLPSHFNAMALLTFYGIFQFFYFLGRAHPNNLFFICMPSILLGAYWLYWLRKTDSTFIPPIIKKTTFVLSLLALGLYMPVFLPELSRKLSQSLKLIPSLPQKVWAAANDLPRDDDFAQRADVLMTRYSGSQKKLIYFFGDRGLDVSMYKRRVNIFPYNDIAQVSICPPLVQKVLNFNPFIFKGEYIYLSQDMNWVYYELKDDKVVYYPLEKTLFYKLNLVFDLKLVEQQNGIEVFQVIGEKRQTS